MDCLEVEASLKANTRALEAATLLRLILDSEEERRNRKVQYLANKRGIPFQDMWNQLRTGQYKPTDEDLREIQSDDL